jgi:NAD dependent epimerase/dehydratase family enzyme
VPVPAFALRLALGEMADTLLASTRLRPERLLATGYRFRFPELEGALRHVLGTRLPRPA